MRQTDRKAAAAAYKERKVAPGLYAVRHAAAGLCWVGHARDLATIWNRLSFTLRHGDHPNPQLQSLWNEGRGEGFVFEELERLDEDMLASARDRALKERLAHWVVARNALKI
jgi:hypothetical protein